MHVMTNRSESENMNVDLPPVITSEKSTPRRSHKAPTSPLNMTVTMIGTSAATVTIGTHVL